MLPLTCKISKAVYGIGFVRSLASPALLGKPTRVASRVTESLPWPGQMEHLANTREYGNKWKQVGNK